MPPLNAFDSSGEPIVEWRQQTLRPDARKFTTLSALYQMTQIILGADGITGFDEKHMVNRPTDGSSRVPTSSWPSGGTRSRPTSRRSVGGSRVR